MRAWLAAPSSPHRVAHRPPGFSFARMKVRPSPRHTRPLCPHDRSNVCCLLCAQLNIANPSTGKQKLIEIEDEKKLCAAPACPAAVLASVLAARTQCSRPVWREPLSPTPSPPTGVRSTTSGSRLRWMARTSARSSLATS